MDRSEWVLVPREKLRDWEVRAQRGVRSGHRCDAVTLCDAIAQSAKAMLAAPPPPAEQASGEHVVMGPSEIMHTALCRIALGHGPAQAIADEAISASRKAAIARNAP